MKVYQKPSIVGEINKGAAVITLAGPSFFPKPLIDSKPTQILNARHKK